MRVTPRELAEVLEETKRTVLALNKHRKTRTCCDDGSCRKCKSLNNFIKKTEDSIEMQSVMLSIIPSKYFKRRQYSA